MSTKTIFATNGAKEYVGGTIVEKTGKNISTDVIQVALGGRDTPPSSSSWQTPDSDTSPTTSSRLIKLLIQTPITPGTYWCWADITDNPEIVPMILQGPIVVI